MASLLVRSAFRSISRRSIHLSSVTRGDKMMNDPLEHATGVEKYELLAKQAGNDNPFDTYVLKPEAGLGLSAKHPIVIPSTQESRMVGCCCEDDYKEVVWFNLQKGPPQKCDCGVHFKLVDYDPMDPNIKPQIGKGFGSGLGSVYY